jgi:DNA-binding CsgD family transcriptional regulator
MNFTVDKTGASGAKAENLPHLGPDGAVDTSSPVPASDPFGELVTDIMMERYPGAYSRPDKDTPYEQAVESDPKLGSDLEDDPNHLHNARLPHYAIKYERFVHRTIIFLKAEGMSNKKIAERLHITPVTVANVIRQPWAQKRILEIIHEKGGDAVSELLNGAAVDAVQRLIIEKDNMEARSAERTAAADKILDRIFGKPNQPLQYTTVDPKNLSDAELEAILRREENLRESNTDS